jgi:hypothetical protein
MTQVFKKPSPSDVVRVTTRYKDGYLWAPSPFIEFVIEGEVVRSEPMDEPHTFRIQTGKPEMPVAQIAMRRVVALEVLKGKDAKKLKAHPDHEWKVKGSKGDIYTVREIDMVYSCTCIGFKFRICKHILGIIAKGK